MGPGLSSLFPSDPKPYRMPLCLATASNPVKQVSLRRKKVEAVSKLSEPACRHRPSSALLRPCQGARQHKAAWSLFHHKLQAEVQGAGPGQGIIKNALQRKTTLLMLHSEMGSPGAEAPRAQPPAFPPAC